MNKQHLMYFCELNKKYSDKLLEFASLKTLNTIHYQHILQILSEFMLNPDCTKDVANSFPHLLPALITLGISMDGTYSSEFHKNLNHQRNCVVLAKLVNINPDLLIYVLQYFNHHPAPFESNEKCSVIPNKKSKIVDIGEIEYKVTDYDIVLACYNILSASITDFKYKWNWSKCYDYLNHEEDRVKWLALKCVSIILGMAESVHLSCARMIIGDITQFLTEHEENNLEPFGVDTLTEDMDNMNEIFQSLTSVKLAGSVLLPVFNSKKVESNFTFSLTKTVNENLQWLAIALSSRKCICLEGVIGCGKTTLVDYLALITGHDPSSFFKVQLSEQMDSKMLLGMYKCTDIPGEFVWQPGILTQAVIGGKWLLLEDIDSAALDVASVLYNLLETGTLSVPGYRDNIYAKNGFQLFVTQRSTHTTTGPKKPKISSATSLLQKHWFCIDVQSLTISELFDVTKSLFPKLEKISTLVVNVYLDFVIDENKDVIRPECNSERLISTRDFIKWCSRAIVDFKDYSPDTKLKFLQDAIDIYCCRISDKGERLNAIKAIAFKLNLVYEIIEYFLYNHTPAISLNPDSFIVGRATLLRKKSEYARMTKIRTNFFFTRATACLLERIACCIVQKEPVLLVGETGTGKTSAIQYLGQITGHKLIVINMNQQSESADLLGGYKPVELKFLISPIREEYLILFHSYFALEPNRTFLGHIESCYKQEQWKTLVTLMKHSTNAALKILRKKCQEQEYISTRVNETTRKKKHDDDENEKKNDNKLEKKWDQLREKLEKLELQVKAQYSLVFSFVEGSLIKALREGYWVLLDEINLANAETLNCLSGLLEKPSGSLSLLERGDNELIERHPDFTIFACMNPATDVGKKDLPDGLRNRFTEFYVDELSNLVDLQKLVHSYLESLNLSLKERERIVKFYLDVRKEAVNTLLDGTGHKPHYSLRTLCRALNIAASNPCGNIRRSLYEAFCLSFLAQLNYDSYPIVQNMIASAILDKKNFKAVIGCPISKPKCEDNEDYICFEGYWVVKGTLVPNRPTNYILTETVRRNLKDLVRVVSIGKIPVLLQGDTSVGKTSLITYLAKASGHICVRINNHEHTDLQEYVGSYVADDTGKLVFREGILVEAMRKGHWIILDELNLAPSDVLEALNRVLDDNRELFIPTTQEVIKAHDNFMLFATQNPPGLYGGRKVLSRAFRNRFIELHFNEIPPNELQIILRERCQMPESYCKQMINVMTDLQIIRKSTAAFAGKRGFITLRDLFRWGERYRLAPNIGNELYDWSQHLADEGYLVLTAKVRKTEEAEEIRKAIKKHLKRDVHPDTLYSLNEKTSSVTKHILQELLDANSGHFKHIVWTYHMRRMAVLVKKSCQFKEPVLLVGETGCGKTTVCQLMAALNGQTLRSINCHMHTESSDFLGNLRPVREHNDDNSKLFEWVDGPLIIAMEKGDLFLADEISLADDSVLERLNSLLEPERSLLLAEKGLKLTDEDNNTIVADDKFIFISTMNPGGDYGKKELSPALRNRFTEIWCEPCVEMNDLNDIIIHNLDDKLLPYKQSIAKAILSFIQWLPTIDVGKKLVVSIRDVLTWVHFINTCTCSEIIKLNISDAYYHGACLTYIDSLGSGLTSLERSSNLMDFKDAALNYIKHQIENTLRSKLSKEFDTSTKVSFNNVTNTFGISPFYITRGSQTIDRDVQFTFLPNTTKLNALKLLRALQLNKPILLEGSPGVGKTSIVNALAKVSGHGLLRINLSDQTDISDLFGADLPVEGGRGGEFSWRDGPFLRALKAGDWILLDELNLASQSVLEGLNACFDHRGEIYIPELGKTFSVKSGTRLFGCQNPLKQGGARRGLPKSFLNRFTQVFIDSLTEDDLMIILNAQFTDLTTELIQKMVTFNSTLASKIGTSWGYIGSPWELNLRDISRWCELTVKGSQDHEFQPIYYNPGKTMELIYVSRMRTEADKQKIREIYEKQFPVEEYPLPPSVSSIYISEDTLYIDDVKIPLSSTTIYSNSKLLILRDQRSTLKQLIQCVQMNWMPILVGSSGCGKSTVVRVLANLIGQKLKCIIVNSAMDTTEILGSFEQIDYNRHLEELLERTEELLMESLKNKIQYGNWEQLANYHSLLEQAKLISADECDNAKTMDSEVKLFLQKCDELSRLISKIRIFEPSQEFVLKEIETKLKALSNSVQHDKCLNAGGKFEWVDSVLVKCLRDGTWLLIDHVNQCSPAVLDRLNGLLEPNGVLTIGERGVDDQGNVVTIKPHKNFRLFLTMDPHYGEISRAMRNRGVEIYMLGPKEKFDYNDRDLKSMLYHSGITDRRNQETLFKLYKSISQMDLFIGNINVHDLMHSAFLLAPRLTRGFHPIPAIKAVCQDVYVKSKSLKSQTTKEKLIEQIDTLTDRSLTENHHNSHIFNVDSLTWSIKNLQENSKLTVIRQEGEFMKSLIDIYVHYSCGSKFKGLPSPCLTDFADSEILKESSEILNDYEISKILSHLLINFYERSTLADIEIRNLWYEKLPAVDDVLKDLARKSKLLANEILSFEFRRIINKSLPWDFGCLPGIAVNYANHEVLTDANKLALLLYFRGMIIVDNAILDESLLDEKSNTISVKQYSNAIFNNKLTSNLKDQPLITDFVKLVHQTSSCISSLLHEKALLISNESYVEIRQGLQYLNRFVQLGERIIINKSEKQSIDLEEITLLLRVHYKWLIKFIFKLYKVCQNNSILSRYTINDMDSLLIVVNEINRTFLTAHNPFRKITKLIKRQLILPLPHTSETSMNLYAKMRETLNNFLPWNSSTSDQRLKKQLKILSIQTNDAMDIRKKMISLWTECYSNLQLDTSTILSAIDPIESFCESNYLNLRTTEQVNAVLKKFNSIGRSELIAVASNIQIWPIYEYLFLLLAHTTYKRICENTINSETFDNELLKHFVKVASIPANLIAAMSTIFTNEINTYQRMALISELCVFLSKFSQNCYAVEDSKMLLHWNGISEDDTNLSVTSYEVSKAPKYVSKAVLMNLIFEFILQRTEGHKENAILGATTLAACTARTEQLQHLNNILWYNSVTLTSTNYDFANNDFGVMKFYLNLYVCAVEGMHYKNDVNELIVSTIEKQGKHKRKEIENTYSNEYLEPIQKLCEAREQFINDDTNNDVVERGRTWMLIGYFELLIFGNLGYIDPVHKINLKLKCLEEEILDCYGAIFVNELQASIVRTSFCSDDIHPRYLAIMNYIKKITIEKENLKLSKAFRSSSANFITLSNDVVNFRNTITSYKLIYKHIDRLTFVINEINKKPSKESIKIAENALREAQMWCLSVQRFAEQMEIKYFFDYPDIVLPLLAALVHLKQGASLLINETKKLISSVNIHSNEGNLETLIYNIIRYPTIGTGQDNLLDLISTCASNYTKLAISKSLHLADTSVSVKEQFRIVKCGLYELFNYIVLNRNLSKRNWELLNELLQQFVSIWKQQQEETEKQKAEKESLYKNKSIMANEEDDLIVELQNIFPTYCENDFGDIENVTEASLEQSVVQSTELKESYNNIISKDDIKEIQLIHSTIVTSFVKCDWIYNEKDNVKPNYIRPLLQRYETAEILLKSIQFNLNENLAQKLHNSMQMLVSQSLQIIEDESTQQMMHNMIKTHKISYDFYKDSNIPIAKKCLPICETILMKINNFLEEWPEHPTLRSIKIIIERIYDFPVTSPVARFLTGLELLLVKLTQWEENAHVNVSLTVEILSLKEQIISWRKLELTCWKNCLETAFNNLQSQTSKWWFYLYALIESYMFKSVFKTTPNIAEENESISKEKLTELLERFINESSLAEFEARLVLLLTFHCHVLYFNPSAERDDVLAILWNIHNYYKQFITDVNKKIQSFKAPVETKLKNFVKIVRWNDISYWSVKESVDKVHRTLHKYVKEYESSLKQSVLSCLTVTAKGNNEDLEINIKRDHAQIEYLINPNDFVVPEIAIKNITNQDVKFKFESESTSSRNVKYEFVSSGGKLLTKAKHYCKEIVLMSVYPSIRMDVENFIEEYIETSTRLKNLVVDRSLPKNKQKSQAKSILQQKKMALADYFKTLNTMGVSYRIGILTWKNNVDKIVDFTISPIDISVIKNYFNLSTVDEQLLIQWKGCDKYYYKSVIKLNALNAILRTTQTDLGVQNIERCRGYSSHMMLMANKQRLILSKLFNSYKPLRTLVKNLSEIDNVYMDVTQELQSNIKYIKESIINLELGFEQLLLYLEYCPNNSSEEDKSNILILETNRLPIFNSSSDTVQDNMKTKLKENLETIRKIAKSFDSVFISTKVENGIKERNLDLYQLQVVEDTFRDIVLLKMQTTGLSLDFIYKNDKHPIVESIEFLQAQIECSIDMLNKLRKLPMIKNIDLCSNDTESIKRCIDNLVKNILLVVQKKYKANMIEDDAPILNPDDDNDDNDKDVDDEFEKNKLKEKLIEDLEKNIEELNISHISALFNDLLFQISGNQDHKRLLLQCLPVMEQYLLLVQFYLNEQVGSLRVTCKLLYLQLNLFLDLATNGFCVPKDLDLEEGDADEAGNDVKTGGMGLAEGEGQKDVSDRIESEDQLEDAKRPDEEEKEKSEDKDCKEEDKGIEMSENFDSKLQDIEKDENDEEQKNDEEDEDLDKEMGETEEGAEKLDKEIWGDDEEESENENNEPKDGEDEQGQGEEIGNKELTANDGSKKEDQNDDKEHHEDERREEEKKEINEINEPEYNDDQIDPYHGKHQPEPEPEPLDLPEDINLDNDDNEKEDNNADAENPFDIDDMKDSKPPPESENADPTEETTEETEKVDDANDDDSSEDENNEQGEPESQDNDDKVDEDADPKGVSNQPQDTNKEEENKEEEENKDEETEEKQELQEKSASSTDDASKEHDAAEQIDSSKDGSKDNVQKSQAEQKQETPAESSQDDSKNTGVGESQSERQESGHAGSSLDDNSSISHQENKSQQANKRKSLETADEDRSLFDKNESKSKKRKVIHSQEEIPEQEQEARSMGEDKDDIDTYQHIKNSEQQFDDCVTDAATENQIKQQASNIEDEENKEKEEEENTNVDLHQDENENNKEEDNVPKQNPEKLAQDKKEQNKNDTSQRGNTTEMNQVETNVEVEGDVAKTFKVERGNDTTFHTNMDIDNSSVINNPIETTRSEVEQMLSEWNDGPSTEEAAIAWNRLSEVTDSAAHSLSEQLRLVLEPTKATRLKGDYRTGKRINMRKIIPYIASQFRKDKIWLRRTKPSKRDYQIVLALDDSSSMADNHSKELAFESLSLISKALTYLEVGQLSVISFGEHARVLHPLGETFTEESGSRLIQNMRFEQKKTSVGQLVDFTVDMFETQSTSSDNAKLVVILSDGRGVFSEGLDKVNRAVRRAKIADIFLVFIIVDNPINKDSILDIRMPIFEGGKLLGIRSYMDSFPFPFYMILRDINMLPGVLSDALRQWFEVVGKIDA